MGGQFFLTFKDPKLERIYTKKKTNPLLVTSSFKIIFLVFVIIVILRRIESLLFRFIGIKSNAAVKQTAILNIALLVVAAIFETIIRLIKKLSFAKGFFYMSYIFVSISYSSFIRNRNSFNDIPSAIPVYICAVIIGSIYTNSWVTASSACMVGAIVKVSLYRKEQGAIYDLIFIDIKIGRAHV